jgi:hypothetical protein
MLIKIEERNGEVFFFLKPETLPESAQIMRVCSTIVGDSSGFVSYSGDIVHGWVSVPLSKNKATSIQSGKMSKKK